MRPLLLKGHTRPLTCVKFNREGDLLFTAAKDHVPCVWYASNGERLGTYNGHVGSVFYLDVNFSTTRLLTASSDTTAKLWDCESGKELFTFPHKSAVRTCAFAQGDRMMLTSQDHSFNQQSTIFIYNLTDDIKQQDDKPVRAMFEPEMKKQNVAMWGNLNQTIISAGDEGIIRVWDVETGKLIGRHEEHKKEITGMQFSKDHTMFITSSKDQTSKLFDSRTMNLLKTYQSDRALNDAALAPTMNLVIMGGGQEARDVTVTAARSGRFETDFHHLVYGNKLGEVKGHFGPINTLAFNPDGKSFASGSEDGYIRLHHFDKEFFSFPQF